MGDSYVVLRHLDDPCRHWYTSLVTNIYAKQRVVCEGTPFVKVAEGYFDYVEGAQRDSLLGKNPYVSRDAAWAYKIASLAPHPFSEEGVRAMFPWVTPEVFHMAETIRKQKKAHES